MITNNSIGRRIKIFAMEKFGGVSKLAERLNIRQSQLSQYIMGVNPNLKVLGNLANLGCDMNWLLTGKKEKQMLKKISASAEINFIKKEVDYLKDENSSLKKIVELLENKIETLEGKQPKFKEVIIDGKEIAEPKKKKDFFFNSM